MEDTDLRFDSRGLLVSVGDFCIVIHKGNDAEVLMTLGFYEGENTPSVKNDFAMARVKTVKIGDDAKFKNAYVFRLHSLFQELQLEAFTRIGEYMVNTYEKTGRISNPKRLVTKISKLVEAPDLPFDIQSAEAFSEEEEDD